MSTTFTVQDCLNDELEYLQELKVFFVKIKYEVMIFEMEKRIKIVQAKINNLTPQSEPIY